MNTRIIDTADAVVRRYKTRNPEEIISQRAIKLKDIRCCRDLLGYYTVMLNCEYIGINPNCTDRLDPADSPLAGKTPAPFSSSNLPASLSIFL